MLAPLADHEQAHAFFQLQQGVDHRAVALPHLGLDRMTLAQSIAQAFQQCAAMLLGNA